MKSFVCTTQSGTQYEISYTETQAIVVRWEDPKGDPRIKGDRIKVWENCEIAGLMADVDADTWRANMSTLLNGLLIRGQNRYIPGHRGAISWTTTKVVRIVREDGKVLAWDGRALV